MIPVQHYSSRCTLYLKPPLALPAVLGRLAGFAFPLRPTLIKLLFKSFAALRQRLTSHRMRCWMGPMKPPLPGPVPNYARPFTLVFEHTACAAGVLGAPWLGEGRQMRSSRTSRPKRT